MSLFETVMRRLGLWSDAPVEEVVPEESKIHNPLSAKVGSMVKIDRLPHRQTKFIISQIQEYAMSVDGKIFKMTDYHLNEDFVLRVTPDKHILLSKTDSFEFSEQFHKIVSENTKFVIDDDQNDNDPTNDTREEYWRVNDIESSYFATVKTLADEDGNGTVENDEVVTSKVEFWDFSRMTEVDGLEEEQFLFVEMDRKNGWFTLWHGSGINPAIVHTFGSLKETGTDSFSVYKAKIDEAADKARQANAFVQTFAKKVESYEDQIASEEREKVRVSNLMSRDAGNMQIYLEEIDTLNARIADLHTTKAAAVRTYEKYIAEVNSFVDVIKEQRREAERLGFELQESSVEKELAKILVKDEFSRSQVEQQIDLNRAEAEVTRQLNR